MSTKRTIKPIGSLIFCPVCGTLLDLPRDDQDEIECHQCGRKEPASCYENLATKTVSSDTAFPSALRSKRDLVQNTVTEEQAAKSKDTISDEKCNKCGKMGLSYYTMQLRSADEGSTVFYECLHCGHKYSQNN